MKLTRQQRRFWYGLTALLFVFALMLVFWAARTQTWVGISPAPGINQGNSTKSIGLLPYLEIHYTNVDSNLQPLGQDSTVIWEWHWLRLALSILATILIGLLSYTCFQYYVRRNRLPKGTCDECGYDLTGVPSRRCPECGTKIPLIYLNRK